MVYRERGDTLVEVLMSIMVLSIIIVGSISLMARGLQVAQSALEHSETRQGVNAQLDMLRYLRDQYSTNSTSADAATWQSIISSSNNNQTDYSGCSVTTAKTGTAFYLDKSSGTVQKTSYNIALQPTTFATPGRGMWIEAAPSAAGVSPAYVDFVVRACWSAVGTGATQQTVTAERLYDPSR
jgi:Tfp pilus assembly protein PilV